MAGVLEGFVVKDRASIRPHLGDGTVVPLDQETLGFVPLTGRFKQALCVHDGETSRVGRFLKLRPGMASWARKASLDGPLFYLLLEFHGGSGFHEVLGWDDGAEAFGPLHTQTPREGMGEWFETTSPADMAVNRALRWAGRDEPGGCGWGRVRRRWPDPPPVDGGMGHLSRPALTGPDPLSPAAARSG